MHWHVGFHDPIPDPNHEPTIFEWSGGLPALTRMTRLFYEKYVPQDRLYADVKAHAAAILERLRIGSMPCDGAWAPEKIDAFERWVNSGMSG